MNLGLFSSWMSLRSLSRAQRGGRWHMGLQGGGSCCQARESEGKGCLCFDIPRPGANECH